ncbi:hypothetical protein ACRWVE_28160 [Escherichia coli]
MKSLTTETALDILIVWLQDNIDCESGIIFDNDEDKTDSAALLPCIEQVRIFMKGDHSITSIEIG